MDAACLFDKHALVSKLSATLEFGRLFECWFLIGQVIYNHLQLGSNHMKNWKHKYKWISQLKLNINGIPSHMISKFIILNGWQVSTIGMLSNFDSQMSILQ